MDWKIGLEVRDSWNAIYLTNQRGGYRVMDHSLSTSIQVQKLKNKRTPILEQRDDQKQWLEVKRWTNSYFKAIGNKANIFKGNLLWKQLRVVMDSLSLDIFKSRLGVFCPERQALVQHWFRKDLWPLLCRSQASWSQPFLLALVSMHFWVRELGRETEDHQ